MLPPLPRCRRWAYSSLKITHPCQPSPVPRPGRPAHRPFRGLLSVHSRCGLHTRTVTVCRDRYPKASDTSSPPCLLRSLPAGAVAGWGLHPPEKRRLVTAHMEGGLKEWPGVQIIMNATRIGGTWSNWYDSMFKCGGFQAKDFFCVNELDGKFKQYSASYNVNERQNLADQIQREILENYYFVPVF